MRPRLRKYVRHIEITRVRRNLERDSFPRLQMFLVVALTGGSGFIASNLLLGAGLTSMGLRYMAAFAAAYLVFLLLLWIWLRSRVEDFMDIPLDVSPETPAPAGPFFSGRGGTFDGGGASGNFETGGASASFDSDSITILPDTQGATTKALSAVDADEFGIPLAVIVIAITILLSTFFMIQSAPVLFAELMVDGALSASLFRRLRGIHSRHWIETALRRTAVPFLLTALIVSAAGFCLAFYVPTAHSIGDVMLELKHPA